MEVGIDIVKIERLKKHENNEKFLNKYFAKTEIEYISKKTKKVVTLAGLYACKEAVLKALGLGIGRGVELKEIVVNHSNLGKPFIEIDAKIQYYLQNLGCSNIAVSISHDGDYAVAYCVIN